MQELEAFVASGFILGNHIITWMLALLAFGATYFVAPRLRRIIGGRLTNSDTQRTNIAVRAFQTVTRHTRSFFIFSVAIWIGTRLLVLPLQVERIVLGFVMVATFVQMGIWAAALLQLWIERYLLGAPQADPARTSAAQIIRIMCLTIIWSAIFLVMLSNFGVDITGLIAGLGIGGIAIAFALQSILKDLFASLAIILDKPFMVGDFIIFDDHLGTVEQIGLKTTRVRSLSGEQISVANDALLNTRVRNFKRMQERRVVFDLHAHYGATTATLKALTEFITATIEAIPLTRFDRAHLADFDELGARFEVVYYVLDPGYNIYMDIQQQILIAVAEWYEQHGLRFAHPSSRIVMDDAAIAALAEAMRPEAVASPTGEPARQ